MSISRRKLLRNGGLLSAAAAFSALLPLKLRAFAGGITTVSVFHSLINSNFKVVSAGGNETVYLTLTKVEEIKSGPNSARSCAGLILQFWGGSYDELSQGLYTVTSLKDGNLAPAKLLLVPSEKRSRAYHAVIYRLV